MKSKPIFTSVGVSLLVIPILFFALLPSVQSQSLSVQQIDPISSLPLMRDIYGSSDYRLGVTSSLWTKYIGNPVLDKGTTGSWDSHSVSLPSVVYKDDEYKLWYSGVNGYGPAFTPEIGFATSPDGITWTRPVSSPVLTVGISATWDSGYVNAPHVIFHDGVYKMWYRGVSHKNAGTSDGAGIGYATSPDGVTWTKYANNPVLRVGAAGSWDGSRLWSPYVLVEGSAYKMWYSACEKSMTCRIGYATSTDGINWTKCANNPVLDVGSSGSWDANRVFYPNVVFNGKLYEVWYSGYSRSVFAIGYATSIDGINWMKYPDNPVITPGATDSWDDGYILASPVIRETNEYKMWYSGNDSINTRIGYATSTSITWRLIYFPLIQR